MTTSSEKIEAAYVIDTVALFRHITEYGKLGRQAQAIFAAAEQGKTQLIVSVIVLAELYDIHKKHNVFDDFRQVYTEIRSQPQFQFVIFSPDDVLDFIVNDSVVGMHDRIIAGLARKLNLPLITKDQNIIDSGIVQTIMVIGRPRNRPF